MTTVLIVDDHAGFRELARRLLEGAGFEVIGEAADGAAALTAAAALAPEALLLDVQLPDTTGFEVSRALAAATDPPAVVLVSSRDATDYGNAVGRCGARGFITKSELTATGFAALIGATG
ncbi:MAG: response regulator [Planctomycetaceae bacterium]